MAEKGLLFWEGIHSVWNSIVSRDFVVCRKKIAPRGQWDVVPSFHMDGVGLQIKFCCLRARELFGSKSTFRHSEKRTFNSHRKEANSFEATDTFCTVYFGLCLLVQSVILFFTHHRPSALNKRKLNVQELLCSFIVGFGENGSRK